MLFFPNRQTVFYHAVVVLLYDGFQEVELRLVGFGVALRDVVFQFGVGGAVEHFQFSAVVADIVIVLYQLVGAAAVGNMVFGIGGVKHTLAEGESLFVDAQIVYQCGFYVDLPKYAIFHDMCVVRRVENHHRHFVNIVTC